mgnify:FL=1|jgi:putative FmdB family regulatory protein
MPIYEYVCEECGHEKEAIQKFSDDPLTDCTECGKPALKKKISASAFHLKGSGWYQTDFKESGSKPAEKKESAPAPSCCAGGKCGTGH